ncbi:MAG TPA: sigma-54 dependent transcriptional regulator [Steroidobacteraceae bacterium]|jgi:two-component system, response regulator FlrC|nr:sigma-54 dependent transcriptional regulator [Steroidobacteraceae bacterium]
MSDDTDDTSPNTAGRDRAAPEPVAVAEVSRRVLSLAQRVAASDCTVLIVGPSGTGKEVLARYIHRQSARNGRPFIAVNCAALPESMLEAILFGYERGAFTGAHAPHAGKFEQAQRGTLLLDEVTEMSLGLQAKLLRVLQEREVERLGGRTPLCLDVRVLATTNRRLREEVSAGRFREDLYYRLNVFPLLLAPLKARREDVLPLAMQLLAARCRPGEPIPALSAEAAHMLLTYPWPGNVRELDNLLQRALILVNGPVIRPEHIEFEPVSERHAPSPASSQEPGREPRALAGSLSEREQEMILAALRSGKNRTAAAQTLGISARTLRYKLARLREAGVELPTS